MRLSLLLTSIFFIVSCASHFRDQDSQLGKIEEYKELIKVEALPPTENSSVSTTATDTSASAANDKTSEQIKKTSSDKNKVDTKKKNKESAKDQKAKSTSADVKTEIAKIPERRKPTYEDSEGFVGRRPLVDPFVPGEKVIFSVQYLGVTAGQLGLKVENFVQVNSKKSYKFSGFIKSSDYYNMIFKVDNSAEAYVDYESLLPYSEELHVKDSKERREARTIFNHDTQTATYWHKSQNTDDQIDEQKATWKTAEYTQGAVTILFYIRNFSLVPGKKLRFSIANRGKNVPMEMEVLKREELVTKLGKFKTLKIRGRVKNEGKLQQTGDSYFWVSDDSRKTVLQFEFHLKIGKLFGKLESLQR